MKSFDSRLQKDLFPKKPAAFDRMVKNQLENVCGQSKSSDHKVIRFPVTENEQKPARGVAKRFTRIGIVAAAAVLILCTVAVGTLVTLNANQRQVMPAEVATAEGTVPPYQDEAINRAFTQKTTVILLPEYTNEMGEDYSSYAKLREANGIPAYSDEAFSWLKSLESAITYLDLNDRTLDFETVFTVPEQLRSGFQTSPINGDANSVVVEVDAPYFVFEDGIISAETLLDCYAAQHFYSDVFANRGDMDPWQLAIAQQFDFRNTEPEDLHMIAILSRYRIYDCRYLDQTGDDADALELNKKCALVGVIEQRIDVDLQTLTSVDAEYRAEIALSGTHVLTVEKEEDDGNYTYSNEELNFDGLVLNETVQYRATGLYVTLSVKDLPDGWQKHYGTSLLSPSAWVAENMRGLSAQLRWGVGEGLMKMLPVESRVPWSCPKDTITFVFPVTANDGRLELYGAELHLLLRAEGSQVDELLSRSVLAMPKPLSDPTSQAGGTDACGTSADETPTPESTETPVEIKTVHVSDVEEFLAAIAPNTEIVLAGGTYDLSMSAEPFTNGNPYCSFVHLNKTVEDEFLQISGVDNLCIRAEEGAECVLHALHKDHCEAVLAAESCYGIVISGITVCGNAENDILLMQCSDVRVEDCELSIDGYLDMEFQTVPNGIGIRDSSNVKVSNSKIQGCASAVYAMGSKSITVSACEIVNCFCATWMSNTDDILFTGCSVHDCRNEDSQSDDGEQGDASYLIQITGQSSSVLTAAFEDCDFYNNKCTFFFSADGVDAVTLSGLKIHDSGFDRLFDFDATADPAGSHVIANCDIDRNKIGGFLFCGLSETRVSLSGLSIVDNEIGTVFFGGDITVAGCLFASPDITHWIGSHESYPDLRTFVHDSDGNELEEDELAAMTYERN